VFSNPSNQSKLKARERASGSCNRIWLALYLVSLL
jgi:hypothetical protein